MLKIFLILFAVMIVSLQGNSQNSNAVFFTENGEKFYVIINGLRQNEKPETNVKITGLTPTGYKIKVIFNDKNLGSVDKNIYMEEYKEYTYIIKKKSESEFGKNAKKVGKTLEKNFLGNPSDTVKMEDKGEWYVIKGFSISELNRPQSTPASGNNYSSGKQSGSTTTTTTQTTSTQMSPAPTGTQFTMSVNLDGSGGNVGMNVSSPDTYYQETTTTTTVTSTGNTENHYVMPGYNGPVGCSWPMADSDFQKAKQTISSKSFEDSKLSIAKQIINSNCLFSKQVKEIMVLFDFEDTRLDLAKYAYGYAYDIGSYYGVNDAFQFESSIDELNNYINRK